MYRAFTDMVKREFFSHTGSNGKDYEARVSEAEWFGGPFGEVIYAGSTRGMFINLGGRVKQIDLSYMNLILIGLV